MIKLPDPFYVINEYYSNPELSYFEIFIIQAITSRARTQTIF